LAAIYSTVILPLWKIKFTQGWEPDKKKIKFTQSGLDKPRLPCDKHLNQRSQSGKPINVGLNSIAV